MVKLKKVLFFSKTKVLISEKLWNSHVVTSITSQSKRKLECLRERLLIISHLQKFAHKISPTLCPKDMSFLQALYCIYLGHTKLICNIFFHGFLVCKFENRDILFSGWKTGIRQTYSMFTMEKTIIKNETVQQIHDMNKNQCVLSTLNTSIKQKLLINNFDTHM